MIKANDRSMIFQTNFSRYFAELDRTRSASLRSSVPKGRGLRPHPVGLASLRFASSSFSNRFPLRSRSDNAVFQTAFALRSASAQAVFQTAFKCLVAPFYVT
jgi:hypothetical protein